MQATQWPNKVFNTYKEPPVFDSVKARNRYVTFYYMVVLRTQSLIRKKVNGSYNTLGKLGAEKPHKEKEKKKGASLQE